MCSAEYSVLHSEVFGACFLEKKMTIEGFLAHLPYPNARPERAFVVTFCTSAIEIFKYLSGHNEQLSIIYVFICKIC